MPGSAMDGPYMVYSVRDRSEGWVLLSLFAYWGKGWKI